MSPVRIYRGILLGHYKLIAVTKLFVWLINAAIRNTRITTVPKRFHEIDCSTLFKIIATRAIYIHTRED